MFRKSVTDFHALSDARSELTTNQRRVRATESTRRKEKERPLIYPPRAAQREHFARGDIPILQTLEGKGSHFGLRFESLRL